MNKLREKFFKECTDAIPIPGESTNKTYPKVNMAPHDLFEWFKPYLQREWIDVNVRYPEPEKDGLSKKVLTIDSLGYHNTLTYDNEFGRWCGKANVQYHNITHWMPLPNNPI